MKIMLDTNILVSAFVFKSNIMNNLINYLTTNHEIIICSYTIEELNYLINNKFKVDRKELDNFLDSFSFKLVNSPKRIKRKLFDIRDQDDYIILHTAIVEGVDIFLTGDKDFNDVMVDKPKIMNVSEFMKEYYKDIE